MLLYSDATTSIEEEKIRIQTICRSTDRKVIPAQDTLHKILSHDQSR